MSRSRLETSTLVSGHVDQSVKKLNSLTQSLRCAENVEKRSLDVKHATLNSTNMLEICFTVTLAERTCMSTGLTSDVPHVKTSNTFFSMEPVENVLKRLKDVENVSMLLRMRAMVKTRMRMKMKMRIMRMKTVQLSLELLDSEAEEEEEQEISLKKKLSKKSKKMK